MFSEERHAGASAEASASGWALVPSDKLRARASRPVLSEGRQPSDEAQVGDATRLRRLQRLHDVPHPPGLPAPQAPYTVPAPATWLADMREHARQYKLIAEKRASVWAAPVRPGHGCEWLTMDPGPNLECWVLYLQRDRDMRIRTWDLAEFRDLCEDQSGWWKHGRLCPLEALRVIYQLINDRYWWDHRDRRDWSWWLSAACREALWAISHHEWWEQGPQYAHNQDKFVIVNEQIGKGFKGSFDGKGNWIEFNININRGKGKDVSKWIPEDYPGMWTPLRVR